MDGVTVTWIAAIVASVIGFGSLVHMSYIAHAWPKATGRVVGNLSEYAHHDCGTSTVYFAEIDFMARDGKTYTVKSDVGLQKPWRLGEQILVHYKPSHPGHAMTLKLWQRLVFSGAFITAALACWGVIFGYLK